MSSIARHLFGTTIGQANDGTRQQTSRRSVIAVAAAVYSLCYIIWSLSGLGLGTSAGKAAISLAFLPLDFGAAWMLCAPHATSC